MEGLLCLKCLPRCSDDDEFFCGVPTRFDLFRNLKVRIDSSDTFF